MKEKAVVEGFSSNLGTRNRKGTLWQVLFQASTIVGIIALIALVLNIVDGAFGYVAYEARVEAPILRASLRMRVDDVLSDYNTTQADAPGNRACNSPSRRMFSTYQPTVTALTGAAPPGSLLLP